MKDPYTIIRTVRLTEKATLLTEQFNRYVFEVDPKAKKPEIKRAIEIIFGKKVIGVNTANFAGKIRRAKRADQGRTNHWKKAIVTLAQGEKIDLV